ncbi:hypothetical protein [Roseibium sp.]|uniref:hypothetical protein n=1 Tax=Roseibium sp. TaxID=1936156 RepID=UPI003D11A183
MIKEHLENAGLRFALRSLRAFRTSDKSGAVLLSDFRKAGNVALVWALDQHDDALSDEASLQLEKLEGFDTVVVVCPPRYFGTLRSRGLFFECLPVPADRALSGVTTNWDLYLKRRVARIRENWAPDFEFTVGRPPEVYCRDFRQSLQT